MVRFNEFADKRRISFHPKEIEVERIRGTCAVFRRIIVQALGLDRCFVGICGDDAGEFAFDRFCQNGDRGPGDIVAPQLAETLQKNVEPIQGIALPVIAKMRIHSPSVDLGRGFFVNLLKGFLAEGLPTRGVKLVRLQRGKIGHRFTLSRLHRRMVC